MHTFFDQCIHSRSTLKQFVEQYETAIIDKVMKELCADYNSKCRSLHCVSPFKWDEQFTKVYTNAIVQLIHDKIKLMWNCNLMNETTHDGGILRYEVT